MIAVSIALSLALLYLFVKVDRIMVTQANIAQSLAAANAKVDKLKADFLAFVQSINQDNASEELIQQAATLTAKLEAFDDEIPDQVTPV